MQCPYCQTENREDRERCYACDKDISMLRLVVNKARHHYNDALEHAERGRVTEAVDELRHALDLDRSFASAHVVLGTLYAKQGEYEKARQSWETALSLQPELDKAHAYLQRVEAVQTSLPALRTYRWITIILLLALVGFTGWWIYEQRTDPNVQRLQSALRLYEQGVYGRALRELEAVRRQSDANSPSNVAAASLRHALQADLRQQVRRIQDLKFQGQYEEALRAITDLEERQPDNATSAALATIRQDIVHYYREEIQKLYEDYENDVPGVDYQMLASHVNRFLELYPDAPEKEEIRSYLIRGREAEAGRAVDRLRQEFARDHNYTRARNDLARLMTQYPGSEALAGGRTDLIDEILVYMFQEFTDLVDKRQFDDAELLLEDILDSSDEFRDVADVSGHAALAGQVLAEARRSHALREAENLLQAGDLESAEEALAHLATDPEVTGAEREVLAELYASLQREQNRPPLPDLSEEEQQRFLSLEMDDEEASSTLANVEDWLARIEDEKERQALLARAAASAVKLEMEEEATSLTARLRREGASQKLLRAVPKISASERRDRSRRAARPTPVPRTIIEPVDPEESDRSTSPRRR